MIQQKTSLITIEIKTAWKAFVKDLRKRSTEIMNCFNRKIEYWIEENKYLKQLFCHICKKGFSTNDDNKKHCKVRGHCHYTGKYRGHAYKIFNLRYKKSKKIPAVFHRGSIYDYDFIIKELANESEGQFECLGKNTETYITFSVPIEKEHDNGKSIKYKITFMDSFRCMS